MTGKIAFCGLDCSECHAFLVSQSGDVKKLQEIALRWGKYDSRVYSVDDIRCDGCTSTILNLHCGECEIRDCGTRKGYSNCGECEDFLCVKLKREWGTWQEADPEQARQNLSR